MKSIAWSEPDIKYNSYNSVLLPFGEIFKMPLISGDCYLRGDCYFRDLIGGQKINVTFGGVLLSEFYASLYTVQD